MRDCLHFSNDASVVSILKGENKLFRILSTDRKLFQADDRGTSERDQKCLRSLWNEFRANRVEEGSFAKYGSLYQIWVVTF